MILQNKNKILLSQILFVLLVSLQINAMKIHPMDVNLTMNPHNKKLRRLPHVFSKVLELPFSSETDVSVKETPDSFIFVAVVNEEKSVGFRNDVRALAVEIHPGVTKIVIRSIGDDGVAERDLFMDCLEIDVWRFRLPASTKPELARAVFVDRELTVTVPKSGGEVGDGVRAWGNVNRVLIVQ